MSHFTVLVPAANSSELDRVLLPYHEYETTGIDEYTEWVISVKANDIDAHIVEIMERITDEKLRTKYQDYLNKGHRTSLLQDWEGGKFDSEGNWGYMTNPNAKWDWYSVGGRWTGTLQLKDDRMGEAFNGTPGLMTEHNNDPQRADSALAGDVDWEGMRQSRLQKKLDAYDLVQEALKHVRTETQPVDEAKLHEQYHEENIRGENFRKTWPTYEAYIQWEMATKWLRKEKDTYLGLGLSFAEILEYYLPRDEYIATREVEALTWAFVDLDGQWVEGAEMGWWGMHDEKDQSYNQAFWRFVEALDAHQRVYVVDCHI